jgi:hypothetical protein
MMQEMYEWYMDNLFPEHKRQAIKHAEKDSRDRKKRLAKGGSRQGSLELTTMEERYQYLMDHRMSRLISRSSGSGLSKWDRIGSPLFASTVDWALIINPYTPPKSKWRAVSRQYERYQEYSN